MLVKSAVYKMNDDPEEESEYVMVDETGNLVTEVHGEGAESDEDISESDEDSDDVSEADSDDVSEEEESEEEDLEPTLDELEGKYIPRNTSHV